MFYTKKLFQLYDKQTNEPISDKYYQMVGDLVNGFARVKYNDKFGYIDESGKEICDTKYDIAENFINGFAILKYKGKYGFIDKNGNEICEIKYDDVHDFCEGFAAVKLDDKWAFIDKTGNLICDFKYTAVSDFHNNFAIVWIYDNCAFIDNNGNEICDFIYSYALNFGNGLAKVWIDLEGDNSTQAYINELGKEICKRYDEVDDFRNGFAIISNATENGYKHGFINTEGKEILTPGLKYDKVFPFCNGMAIVGNYISKRTFKFKYGYIDENGTEVIKCQYDDAKNFENNGSAQVEKLFKTMYINKKGNII